MEAKKGKAFVVLKAVLDPFATSYQLQKTQFSYRTPSQNYAQNGFDLSVSIFKLVGSKRKQDSFLQWLE